MLEVLKELLTVAPLWVKLIGAVAMVMLVLAVIGTDLSVGRGGVSFHADLLRHDRNAPPVSVAGGKGHSIAECL